MQSKRISSIKKLAEVHYPYLTTESGWRWILFNRETNGFAKCVIKRGRRVYVDLDLVDAWLDEQKEVCNG